MFSKEGDAIGYLYDFGDKWHHDIKVCTLQSRGTHIDNMMEVEKILPDEESDGQVEVIEAKGMCPGGTSLEFAAQVLLLNSSLSENMDGSWSYNKFLQEYDEADKKERLVLND